MPMTPFNITSATLGLLLVFRTNVSYARWDEARKMWGLMVNRTRYGNGTLKTSAIGIHLTIMLMLCNRDMNRQYAAYFPPPSASEKRAFMQRWTVAFVYSLKCHLREKGDLSACLKDQLREDELEELLASPHKPLYALQALAAGVAGSGANSYIKGVMDQNLTQMEDVLGGCERLLRTPIPLSYTRHTTRFLVCWLKIDLSRQQAAWRCTLTCSAMSYSHSIMSSD